MTRSGKRSGGGSPGRPDAYDRFRTTVLLFLGVAIIVYQAFIAHTDRKWLYGVAFVLMGFVDERTIGRLVQVFFPRSSEE